LATIRDIARVANVSVPTVSRVLNDRTVAEHLALRVRQAVKDLNYMPNRAARRLRGSGNRLWGAIFSDITNSFYTEVLKGVEQGLSAEEATLIFGNANSDPAREANLIQVMREEGVSGLIIAPTSEEKAGLQPHLDDGFPIVVVDRRMNGLDVDSVSSDNLHAAFNATMHLVQIGHRRVGFIGGPDRLSSARDRYAGYLEAMRAVGLATEPSLTRFGDYHMETGFAEAQHLLSLAQPPSAMLVANNEMVIGALNAIHGAGRKIPDDIAIVGFDDFPWAISLNPPLTTVAQPAQMIGRRAAELLLERVADPALPARAVTFETELIVRMSCGSGAAQTDKNGLA